MERVMMKRGRGDGSHENTSQDQSNQSLQALPREPLLLSKEKLKSEMNDYKNTGEANQRSKTGEN